MADNGNAIGCPDLDTALAEYKSATLTAARQVRELLSVGVAHSGTVATTLHDLRQQAATRLRYDDGDAAVITAPGYDPASDVFASAEAAAARFAVRSAIRLAHDLAFTAQDEVAVGVLAVAAIRSAGKNLSQLAFRLAEADHVEHIRATSTLGRPVRVQRDFVVRCAVLGLGEALNAEHEPDLPTSVAVEAWLSRTRQHRR
jgi:hypothetical protein